MAGVWLTFFSFNLSWMKQRNSCSNGSMSFRMDYATSYDNKAVQEVLMIQCMRETVSLLCFLCVQPHGNISTKGKGWWICSLQFLKQSKWLLMGWIRQRDVTSIRRLIFQIHFLQGQCSPHLKLYLFFFQIPIRVQLVAIFSQHLLPVLRCSSCTILACNWYEKKHLLYVIFT